MGELLQCDDKDGSRGTPGAPRLSPTMSSRKLLALDFIKSYFARWSHSPTLGELASHLGVSRKRAYDLVHQLSEEKMLEVVAGKTRGIRLIERGTELSETDILVRLVALGWTVGQGSHVLMPPSDAVAGGSVTHVLLQALTTKGLPDTADLDHDPDPTEDEGNNGETGQGARTRGRAAAAPGRATGSKSSSLGSPAP